MKYENIGKKRLSLRKYGSTVNYSSLSKNKCKKMACKYKAMRNGERSEKHK